MTSIGGRIVLEDVFTEGSTGQYIEVDLVDPSTGDAIDTGAIEAATATLRSLQTGAVLLAATSVMPGGSSRGSFPGAAGRLRVSFTAADLASSGSREFQLRELTLLITHSGGKVFPCVVQFPLRNSRDIT